MSPAASVSCALGHPSLPQGAGESSLKGLRFMLLKHHFPEDVPPREPTGRSPTTRSCSRASAATEEPSVEGKVHNSREGPVDTAATGSAFSLPNPSSGDQALRAILLFLRIFDQVRGKNCRLPRATRTLRQRASSWPSPGVGTYPVSLTLSTTIKGSCSSETLFSRYFLFAFPFL